MKRSVPFCVAATVLYGTSGISIAAAKIHEGFSLSQARQVDIRYEHKLLGNISKINACRWLSIYHRRAACSISTGPIVVTTTNGVPMSYTWDDIITRSGACQLRTTKQTGLGSGIVSGVSSGTKIHNCFNGPLVVLEGTEITPLRMQTLQT